MQTTLTGLRREAKGVARALTRGETVELTEHGKKLGRIRPDAPRLVVSAAELRVADFTDVAILQAIDEARD